MNRTQIVATRMFALVLAFGAVASTSAYALPHLGMHRHPSLQQADGRVSLQIMNKGFLFRDIRIEDQIYTLLPHHTLTIKAPAGTAIYSNSTGGLHHKGDMLFEVNKKMQGSIVTIN